LKEKYRYSFAPLSRTREAEDILLSFLNFLKGENLKNFNEFYNSNRNDLVYLENMNKDLSLFIWLLYRVNYNEEYIEELLSLYDSNSIKINNLLSKEF
jgi:hypothetical protein